MDRFIKILLCVLLLEVIILLIPVSMAAWTWPMFFGA